MLEVPKRPPAFHCWYDGKVVNGWWGRCRPLQGPRVPWIIARRPPPKVRPDQVEQETQYCHSLEHTPDAHDHVPGSPSSFRLVSVDPPCHSKNSRNGHEVESEVEPDQEQPEMPFAEGLVEHPPGYFRIPIIESAEEGENDSTHDHVVEMRYHKIGAGELPVERRGSEHNSRQAAAKKLKQKGEAEQHGRGIADLPAPHRTQPVKDLDTGRYGDRTGGEHKEGVGVRGHAHGKHVMGPNAQADKSDAHGCRDHNRVTED